MPSNGKVQQYRRFPGLPSNAVECRLCRAVAEQGYNLGPGFVTFPDQPGEHDGRTIPSNTAIRRPAGFVEGNCGLPQRDVRTVQRWEKREAMCPSTVTCMTGLARCTRPGPTWMRGCAASIGAKAGNWARIRAISKSSSHAGSLAPEVRFSPQHRLFPQPLKPFVLLSLLFFANAGHASIQSGPSETRDCQSGFNLLNALESGFHGHSGSGDIALHVSEHIARLVPLNDGEFSRG